jgi:hypothetical protein
MYIAATLQRCNACSARRREFINRSVVQKLRAARAPARVRV